MLRCRTWSLLFPYTTLFRSDLAVRDLAKEAGLRLAGGHGVVEPDRRPDLADRLGPGLGQAGSSGSKHSMSWISPTVSARQRTLTRIPVRILEGLPASTA